MAKVHHSSSYAYAVWNRQALALLAPEDYVRLTPRNGKYNESMRAQRDAFELCFSACTLQ